MRSKNLKFLLSIYFLTFNLNFRVYANHAKKKVIDLEDVKLASQLLLDKAFTGPPPREVLLEVARAKNSQPLSFIKPHSGIRLPPERYCLLAQNYKLRAATSANPTKKLLKSAIEPRSTIKTQFKSPAITSQNANKQPSLSQSQQVAQSEVIIPRPLIKVNRPITKIAKPSDMKMEVDDEISLKRKRSEDEFEIV